MKTTAVLLLLALLCACGDSSYEDECPVVTETNVHLMTGDLPPGHPCTQDYRVRENAPNVPGESKLLVTVVQP